jgi:hypothetical protein
MAAAASVKFFFLNQETFVSILNIQEKGDIHNRLILTIPGFSTGWLIFPVIFAAFHAASDFAPLTPPPPPPPGTTLGAAGPFRNSLALPNCRDPDKFVTEPSASCPVLLERDAVEDFIMLLLFKDPAEP